MRKSFTDNELRTASKELLKLMYSTSPDLSEYEADFSDEFYAKIDKLIQKITIRRQVHSVSKQIAAVFAAMIIGLASWIAFDTDTSAAFFEWIQNVYENSVVYRYFGDKEQDELPQYGLSWLPDGFEELLNDSDALGAVVYCCNPDTGEEILFEYRYLDEGSILQLNSQNETLHPVEIEFDGKSIEFYPAEEGSTTNNMVWIDEETDILFMLNGTIEKSVMLAIIENIKLVDSTK